MHSGIMPRMVTSTSGAHDPLKSDCRALGATIETAIAAVDTGSGYVGYADSTARDADTSQADGTLAIVDGDLTIYRWNDGGSTWEDSGNVLYDSTVTDALDTRIDAVELLDHAIGPASPDRSH